MIGLLGATGTIGSRVAALLGEQDAAVRCLVRDPSRVHAAAVRVDLRDPDSLRRGIEGCDQLFLLTAHSPDQDLHEAAAVDAAVAAGIRRIVKLSGGAPSLGPNGPASTAVSHWRSERRIEESGLSFCFLRPSFLMQNIAGLQPVGRLLPAPISDAPIAMIDARDVARCAVAALLEPDAPDQAWHLTGPAGVTFSTVARSLGLRYVQVPPSLAARAMKRRGASAFEIEHALRMARYFSSGADGTPTDSVARLTGRAPASLNDYLQQQKGNQ
jgi:uncharacterized protein YbjT (DUF2867 family)